MHEGFINIYIPRYCYSGGSMVALCGDNIYMNNYSLLSPVDPQISFDDQDEEDEDSEEATFPDQGWLTPQTNLNQPSAALENTVVTGQVDGNLKEISLGANAMLPLVAAGKLMTELLLVYRLALIWEWRTGIKPVRTAYPEDGRPKDEFYRWAAMQIDKSPLWVFKRHWKNSVLFAALEREQEGLPFYREELKKFCLAASHSPSVPLSSHSVSCHSSGSRSW